VEHEIFLPVAWTIMALAGLLVAEYRGSRAGKWLFKPAASAGFIATALVAGVLDSTYGLLILAGLALSLLGDVLLILRARTAFLAGLIAFLLGHVAYAGAFWVYGVALLAVLTSAMVLLIVCVWLGRRYLPRIETAMHRPVIAYAVVISLMLALASGAVAASGPWIILFGAGFFYLSDLSVAQDRLIDSAFIHRAWGLPAYYSGQLLLAASVMF